MELVRKGYLVLMKTSTVLDLWTSVKCEVNKANK